MAQIESFLESGEPTWEIYINGEILVLEGKVRKKPDQPKLKLVESSPVLSRGSE